MDRSGEKELRIIAAAGSNGEWQAVEKVMAAGIWRIWR